MKQILSAMCAILALAAVPLWAGKRIQMESTDLTKNKVTARELLIDADRLRFNDGQTSMIFLTKGGERMLILDKGRNEYQEIDKAAVEAMGQQMGGMMAQMEAAMKGMPPEQRAMIEQMMKGKMPQAAAPAAAKPATTYAAKGSGTANGFRCNNYEGSEGGAKVSEICAAAPAAIGLSQGDFQVTERMRAFFQPLADAMKNGPMAGMMPQASVLQNGVNGFPVQSVKFASGKAVEREDVKAVTDASFTDADFSVGNARRTEMPGAGKGKGKGR